MSYDNRKKRNDKYDYKASSSSFTRNKYDEHDDRDDYYQSKKIKSSKSRSRSRSPPNRYTLTSTTKYGTSNSKPTFGFNGSYETKKFNPGPPSRTIMLRHLPLEMDDNEMRNEFNILMVPYKDIRLVKHRDTNISRGFAFVEFSTVEEAQAWMNSTQGWLMFSNYDNKIQMFYSHSSADEVNSINAKNKSVLSSDWDCAKCGIKNFKRRDKCFKCGITREESERRKDGEGYEFAGTSPCNTLILRGLDALTTKDTIVKVFNEYSNYNLPVKNCHIAKDVHTNVSNGFAFVEMNSIQDAGYMLQLVGANIEIDGKQVVVNYCKNTYKTAISQLEEQSKKSYFDTSDNSMYVHNTHVNNKVNQADQANSAAAVAQAALQSMQKKQELLSHFTSSLKDAPTVAAGADLDTSLSTNLQYIAKQVDMISNKSATVYQTPDVSQFTYDETSGYYYDYTTGFYYDPTSQYYYNSITQQYMYWDPASSTYVPVSSATSTSSITTRGTADASTTVQVSSDSEPKTTEDNKPVKTNAKPKTAAQIAKDMERWAKENMNKKKELVGKTKPATTTTTVIPVTTKPFSSIESTATTVQLEKPKETLSEPQTDLASTSNKKSSSSSIQIGETITVRQDFIESGSENSNEMTLQKEETNKQPNLVFDESNLIDTVKIACLLCKRKFDSIDILNKHVAKSDLHKTNLEKLKKHNSENGEYINQNSGKTQQEIDTLQAALQYRDRAKERREKFGLPDPPSPPSKSRSSYEDYSVSNSTSISFVEKNSDTVASKMMRKMGWNEGAGIGKNLQGISVPIEATMRQKGAGLGASKLEIDPNDSYQAAVRKSAKARFEQLS